MMKLQRGFTLVELMIVVTIISVLATTAISNFKLFQQRAKQSEAKINLRGIYTAKMTHYGETDTFHCYDENGGLGHGLTDLVRFGNCTGEGRNLVGFCGWDPGRRVRYLYMAVAVPVPGAILPVCDPSTTCNMSHPSNPADESERSFTANAMGNIDSDSTCDEWSINDSGTLVNDVNDVTEGSNDE